MKNNGERQILIGAGQFNIAYRQWGQSGTPVLLLHGIPMNSTLWMKTGYELSKQNYQVYAPEMLGLGYTDGPIEYDHSLKGQAEMIKLFIKEVIKEEPVLVGHDLGGGVAQIIISEPKPVVKKCILTNCVAFDSWPPAAIKPLVDRSHSDDILSSITYEYIYGFVKKALSFTIKDNSLVTGDLIKDIADGLAGSQDKIKHFISFLRKMDNKYTREIASKLSDFKKPTLLVWAKDDIFQPLQVGERLKSAIPGSKLLTLEGGHFHPLESSALAHAIIEWGNE